MSDDLMDLERELEEYFSNNRSEEDLSDDLMDLVNDINENLSDGSSDVEDSISDEEDGSSEEEDSYNETNDTRSDILYDGSLINENNNEYNESEVPWVRSNCNSDEDVINLEPYEQRSVDNHDLFVIKTFNERTGRFGDASTCYLKSSLISELLSNREQYPPSMIKCIYDKPGDDNVIEYGQVSLKNGMCCKPTDIFVVKLGDGMIITLNSFIDLISTDTQIWYAVRLYSGKRKRIGNIEGEFTSSSDHGQLPGSYIYKLYTKEQILPGIKPEETDLYPLHSLIIYREDVGIHPYTDARDFIRYPNEITNVQVLRMIDILTILYTNNKFKIKMNYKYIYSNISPSDYSLEDIEFLINNHKRGILPHWLHPHAKTTITRDNNGNYHTVGYYNSDIMAQDLEPVIPSRNLLNKFSQNGFILKPGVRIQGDIVKMNDIFEPSTSFFNFN